MVSSRRLKTYAAAAVALAIGGIAFAQRGPPDDRAPGMWRDGSGWHMGMGMWGNRREGRGSEWMLERIEGRLAFTKTELKITEAQTAAWNQLADAVRAAARHHNERMKNIFAGTSDSRPLPERIEAQEQFMAVRLEEIRLIKSAVRNLYGMLSEEQKKEADELGIPMAGMMGPRG